MLDSRTSGRWTPDATAAWSHPVPLARLLVPFLLSLVPISASETRDPGNASASPQITMNRVAVIDTPSKEVLARPDGLDFDHDDLREFVLRVDEDYDPLEFYECIGDNTFVLVHTLDLENSLFDSFPPADAGDTDGDGLAEIVLRVQENLGDGSGNADHGERIYESLTVDSYPTELTWSASSPLPSPWTEGGRIVDGDGDGKQEIVAVHNASTEFVVFENVGNDSYVQTHLEIIPEDGLTGQSFGVTDDIDGDGKAEVLFGAVDRIFAFESTGDDSYELIWTWDFEPNSNVMSIVDGGDLDGDGLKELIVTGQVIGAAYKLFIFEPVGDNAVEIVTVLTKPGDIGFSSSAVADVDGDGKREIVFGTPAAVSIYGNAGDNAWEEIWTTNTGGLTRRVGAGDHDKDGKDEIIFRTGGNNDGKTSVWEIDPAYQADMDGDDQVDVIDNCPADFNPGQEDADADGVGDVCDNCALGPNPAQGPAPMGQTLLAVDKQSYAWPVPAPVIYLKGSLAAVSAYAVGEVTTLPQTSSFSDPSLPLGGSGFYYLVRPDCPVGSWQTEVGAEPGRDVALP